MLYVAEINRLAVCAFDAEDQLAAETLVGKDWFKSALRVLETKTRPLWDGESEIHVRKPNASERLEWNAARDRRRTEDKNDNADLVFLVPVSNPTDEDL